MITNAVASEVVVQIVCGELNKLKRMYLNWIAPTSAVHKCTTCSELW